MLGKKRKKEIVYHLNVVSRGILFEIQRTGHVIFSVRAVVIAMKYRHASLRFEKDLDAIQRNGAESVKCIFELLCSCLNRWRLTT